MQIGLFLIAAVIAVVVVAAMIRSGHFLRSLFFSCITGNIALFSVGYLGAFTGVVLTPNLFTLLVASLLGIPGVLGMLLLRLLFQ